MDVDETEQEGNEAAEDANEAEELQPEQSSDEQKLLLEYCMSLEEQNDYLMAHHGQLPGLMDSVLDHRTVDMGMIAVEDAELTRDFAAMGALLNHKPSKYPLQLKAPSLRD